MPSSTPIIISKCTIHHPQNSTTPTILKLSVSDLPMLSCHYIQKGVLLPKPPHHTTNLISLLKHSLSSTLHHFPALAGRLITDDSSQIHILCNNAGVDFIHADAKHLAVSNILSPTDVPDTVKDFFAMDRTLSYSGHVKPLVAVQVTELVDGLFVACTVNHSLTDGTSFWHFFNMFAQFCKEGRKVLKSPEFCRDTVFDSPAVLRVPAGGPKVTFSDSDPLRERIFHFSREAISKLKQRANSNPKNSKSDLEFGWKTVNDNGKITADRTVDEISSFQSLSAQLWRSVTRARNLPPSKTTTFRMAVNCRHRLEPRLEPYYFGNAIQSIPTVATSGDLLSADLNHSASLLHRNVVAHDDLTVRRGVEDWERNPRLFPLGNFDGAMITMGSSPRFPMYDNDFGWGRPLAVRSGKANKFDGKISAFPAREGGGSVDLEVCLAPETMVGLENDEEFMQYVSSRV